MIIRWPRWLAGIVFALAAGARGAQAPGPASIGPCAGAAHALPARVASAPGGRAFARSVAATSGVERDRAIVAELLAGNLPQHLRRAQAVVLSLTTAGATQRLTVCVLPDYLAIGSDDDSLLVPMGLAAALEVARDFGFELPTRRIVDAIREQSAVRLDPQPLPAGDQMRSTAYVERHNALVRAQRELFDAPLDALTSGHKKDLVLSNRLWDVPGRVAIYGWHRLDGRAIQPLSTVHGARYADYSHGVRLVSTTAFLDGHSVFLDDVLRDPVTAWLASDEGPIPRLGQGQSPPGAAE